MTSQYEMALIELHRGLDYKGPGDNDFSRTLLDSLPPLPQGRSLADLGCGSGASALVLAQHYQSPVKAVDSSAVFLEELQIRAKTRGLDPLIVPWLGDMAQLPWPEASLALIWSEGAAYNLGFEQALKIWRPLLADGGFAVISEMSWFREDVPQEAIAYWQQAYPLMAGERENRERAHRAGFKVITTRRLPSHFWWQNYYEPLRQRMQQLEATPLTQAVIQETEVEMAMFAEFSDFYGYSFYILQPDEKRFSANKNIK